jgi:hypothetical protein
VLSRDGYAYVHTEAERFIAILFSNHEPAASGQRVFILGEDSAATPMTEDQIS